MLTDQLREAVANSGLSVYAVAKGAGVTQPSLFRFMRGERSLRLDMADKLAEYFQMHLTRPKRPKMEG